MLVCCVRVGTGATATVAEDRRTCSLHSMSLGCQTATQIASQRCLCCLLQGQWTEWGGAYCLLSRFPTRTPPLRVGMCVRGGGGGAGGGGQCQEEGASQKIEQQTFPPCAPVAPWDAYGRGSSRCIFWVQI